MRGTITTLPRDKTFGFILGEDGVEYFFFPGSLTGRVAFANLAEQDAVVFEPDQGPKGPRAKDKSVTLARLDGLPQGDEDDETEESAASGDGWGNR